MANYPTSDPSFTTKNNGETIQASHVVALQDEVTAIGSGLRGTLQHNLATTGTLTVGGVTSLDDDLKFTDATYDIGKSGATRPRDGFFSRNLAAGGTLDVTGLATLGIFTSATQPRARAYNNGTQVVNANTSAVLTLGAESFDVGAMHSTSSNTERLTVPSAGLYLVIGKTIALSAGNGSFDVTIRANGNAQEASGAITMTGVIQTACVVMTIIPLSATDYVDLFATATANNMTFGAASATVGTSLMAIKLC